MQASIIAWIPAVIWAWRIVHRPEDTPEIVDPSNQKPSSKKPVRKPS